MNKQETHRKPKLKNDGKLRIYNKIKPRRVFHDLFRIHLKPGILNMKVPLGKRNLNIIFPELFENFKIEVAFQNRRRSYIAACPDSQFKIKRTVTKFVK